MTTSSTIGTKRQSSMILLQNTAQPKVVPKCISLARISKKISKCNVCLMESQQMQLSSLHKKLNVFLLHTQEARFQCKQLILVIEVNLSLSHFILRLLKGHRFWQLIHLVAQSKVILRSKSQERISSTWDQTWPSAFSTTLIS